MADLLPALAMRRVRLDDVSGVLALIGRAVEHGCRGEYTPAQRRAVVLTYARSLYYDVTQPLDTVLVERRGGPVAFAQLDPAAGRLRALFVDADAQGWGVGRALLRAVEELAAARGCGTVVGAMSLNAVPFYARQGYVRWGGPGLLQHEGVRVPVVPMGKRIGGRDAAG